MDNAGTPQVPTKEQQVRVVAPSMAIVGWVETIFLSVLFSDVGLIDLFHKSDASIANGFVSTGSISIVVAMGILGALVLHFYGMLLANKIGDVQVKRIIMVMLVLFLLAIFFVLPVGVITTTGGIAGVHETAKV